MAPATPKSYSAGSNPVTKFEGAFEVTKHTPPAGRNILFNVQIRPDHPRLLELASSGKKPPTHFHPRQWEFFKVVRGALTVEIDGKPHVFRPEDGEFKLKPGPHHCLYAEAGQDVKVVEFWLSASARVDPGGGGGGLATKQLDQAFFENWYGYQEDVMLRGQRVDLIQVLSMFDAGDSYLSPPAWLPFRHFLGYWMGVILGRYIGGLLGYQPFFPEWTTDWDAACVKMKSHWSQRKFAVQGAQEEVRARYVELGEDVGNGGLVSVGGAGKMNGGLKRNGYMVNGKVGDIGGKKEL